MGNQLGGLRIKIEQFLGVFFASQATAWLSYYFTWMSGDPFWSAIITGAVTIPASIVSSIAMIALVRIYRLVNTLNEAAKDAESEIAGVAMKTDAAATAFGENVVGPSDLQVLDKR